MISEQLTPKDDRLILACDKPTRQNATQTIVHVMRRCGGVKLTPEFIRNEDYLVFGAFAAKQGLPIIYDANTSHPPILLQRSVNELSFKLPREGEKPRQVAAVTISGAVPIEWMRELVERARERNVGTKLLAVGASPDMTAEQIGRIHKCSPAEWTAEVAANAREAGMDGLVASAMDAEDLFGSPEDPFKLWAVGLRARGQEMYGKDPSRTCMPLEAIAVNASKLIVGNLLTRAPDPVAAADALVAELRPSCATG